MKKAVVILYCAVLLLALALCALAAPEPDPGLNVTLSDRATDAEPL